MAGQVAVIIPAHNAGTVLGACLEALRREGLPGAAGEVIVVDDASTDATAMVAQRAGVRVLRAEGRGPAAARNMGAQAAAGDVLIFLDADTEPEPGWLAALLKPLEDPQMIAVKGAYSSAQPGILPRFVQLEFEHKYDRLAQARRVDFVDTGTAAFRRPEFLASGGFDERFPANSAEDVDLAFRLADHGARFAFSAKARVRHRHPERLRDYLLKKARYGYYRVDIYRRFPTKALGDSYTPPSMGMQIALAGVAALLSPFALANWRSARRGWAATLAAFCATTVPLMRSALRTDPALAPLVPGLVFARAFAQGVGIMLALARGILRNRLCP